MKLLAKWSVDDYHRMLQAGILRDRRVELLAGEVVEMSQIRFATTQQNEARNTWRSYWQVKPMSVLMARLLYQPLNLNQMLRSFAYRNLPTTIVILNLKISFGL